MKIDLCVVMVASEDLSWDYDDDVYGKVVVVAVAYSWVEVK